MHKSVVQWQARKAWGKLYRQEVCYIVGLVIAFGSLLVCAVFGIRTADTGYSLALWLLLGISALAYCSLEISAIYTLVIRAFQTRYILTGDSLFITVGKTMKIIIPRADLHSYCMSKNERGLIDIHITVAEKVNIVLKDIRENAKLHRTFGIPHSAS